MIDEKVVKLLQEVMNKIVDAEEKAQAIRTASLADSKAAQADAVRQGRSLIDQARKRGSDAAKALIDEANADAQLIAQSARDTAAQKAGRLRADSDKGLQAAARFVMERIVNSV